MKPHEKPTTEQIERAFFMFTAMAIQAEDEEELASRMHRFQGCSVVLKWILGLTTPPPGLEKVPAAECSAFIDEARRA